MSSTDLVAHPEHMRRIRKLYPGAIGWGVIEGSQHRVRRELRLWEARGEVIGVRELPVFNARGEVIAVRKYEVTDKRRGTTRIPYVRMKTHMQVRREQSMRIAAMSGAGVLFLAVVCWMVWDARYVIMGAAGMTALLILGWRFLPHWGRGCSGLHCAGCRG